jgi:hypothetical protein
MEIQEFEEKLQEIRSKNGWIIKLEFNGIWVFTIIDKRTGNISASTGATGLESLLYVLEMPFDKSPWQ